MKRSIFYKIFSGYFLVTVTITFLILLFSFRLFREYHINTLADELKNLGTTIRFDVAERMKRTDAGEFRDYIDTLGGQIDTRITIIDADGVVIADSEQDPAMMENHINRVEIREAAENSSFGQALRYSNTVQRDMLYVALPIIEDEKIAGFVRTSFYVEDLNTFLDRLQFEIFEIGLIIFAISIFGAFLLSKSFSRPIRDLAEGANRVASGDFDVTILLKSEDELRELADSFNYMTGRIKNLFSQLSQQKEELNSIISSMRQGLVVLDKNDRITLANRSFTTYFPTDDAVGRVYWEVVREPLVAKLVKQVRRNGGSVTEEIFIDPLWFACSAMAIPASQSVFLIFHDITKIKNLEQIKKDFVLNVSHELRTPLTAIKGFVETLEDEIGESGRRYLDIIRRHTDRLVNIVQDLLELSEIEEKGRELRMESVDIAELIEGIARLFDYRLEEKELSLSIESDMLIPPVSGDHFKLEQLFINLFDNAIKYTESGGITIRFSQTNAHVRTEFADTGAGIAKEHLPRLFERFYVTDKSRSRKLGGTGLGLAIVKHIVLLHDGSINVKSAPGKGTTFIIDLPVASGSPA